MKDFIKLTLITTLVSICFSLSGQYKIGVRAGLNYSTWKGGELEQGEELGISTGFHFGINYTYQLSPILGLRAELLYIQRGSNISFSDPENDTYLYINPVPSSNPINPFFAYGQKEISLAVSHGYLSIPLTVHYQPFKKFEFFGGASIEMLLNPTGKGSVIFTHPDFFFRQNYEHNYARNKAGEVDFLSASQTVLIEVDGQIQPLYKSVTAYYDLEEEDLEDGKKYKFFDSNLILGFNYFINSGFYVGVRGEYGLFDLTNTNLDFSLREINSDETYIKREDKDKSRSVSVSFGFRF